METEAEAGTDTERKGGELTGFGIFDTISQILERDLTAFANFDKIWSDIENYTVGQFIYRLDKKKIVQALWKEN
jgi:hypothetical protein